MKKIFSRLFNKKSARKSKPKTSLKKQLSEQIESNKVLQALYDELFRDVQSKECLIQSLLDDKDRFSNECNQLLKRNQELFIELDKYKALYQEQQELSHRSQEKTDKQLNENLLLVEKHKQEIIDITLQLIEEKGVNKKLQCEVGDLNTEIKTLSDYKETLIAEKVELQNEHRAEIKKYKKEIDTLQQELDCLKQELTKDPVTKDDVKNTDAADIPPASVETEEAIKLVSSSQDTSDITPNGTKNSDSVRDEDEGNPILFGDLNLGDRKDRKFDRTSSENIYMGNFLYVTDFYSTLDSDLYPYVKTPKYLTPVLRWIEIPNAPTVGVTEPLLMKELQKLTELQPEIKIIRNVALQIHNREYSYIPDCVLVWEKYHLCIDIEIDEPYEFAGRTPIHNKGSKDRLRDLDRTSTRLNSSHSSSSRMPPSA